MDYEDFAERIKPLFDFDSYVEPKKDIKPVVRISVKKGEIIKTKFSQLNDKRFYFPSVVISLPFEHCVLNDIDKFKKSKGQRIENYFLKEKEHLLKLEKEALKKCPRLDFLNNILLQSCKVVPIDTHRFKKMEYFYNEKKQTVLDSILSAGWKTNIEKITPTMESLRVTSS